MARPAKTDNKPKQVDLKQGEEYYICACAGFSNQPLVDSIVITKI